MTYKSMEAIEAKIESILKEPTLRAVQLSVFAESLDYIAAHGEATWLTHVLRDRIRLLAGRLIVVTITEGDVWVTTAPEYGGHQDPAGGKSFVAHDDSPESGHFPGATNRSAYESASEPSGLPLRYITLKMGASMEHLHTLCRVGRGPDADTSFRVGPDALVQAALAALRCALKAYLALQNMTSLADDEDLFEQLLAMPAEDFSEWLSWIDAEGSAAS